MSKVAVAKAPADIDKFVYVNPRGDYNARYILYNSDSFDQPSDEFVEKCKNARSSGPRKHGRYYNESCFSRVKSSLDGEKTNRIVYYPEIRTTMELARKWITLCVGNGILPPHIDPAMNYEKGFVFDTTVPLYLLYIHLCHVRYLKEDPNLVAALVYLVEEEGLDIHAALVLCGSTIVGHPGHNYLPGESSYVRPKLSKYKLDVKSVFALKRLMSNPGKYESNTISGCAPVRAAIKDMPEDLTLKLTVNGLKQTAINSALMETDFSRAVKKVDRYRKYLDKKAAEKAAADAAVAEATAKEKPDELPKAERSKPKGLRKRLGRSPVR